MRQQIVSAANEFQIAVKNNRPEAWRLLRGRQPIATHLLSAFSVQEGFAFPEDLSSLYLTMDGYPPEDSKEEKEVVPGFYFLPFADAYKQFKSSDYGPEFNNREWILFSDFGGTILYRLLRREGELDERIYIRNLEAGLDKWCIYNGIATMLLTMAEWLNCRTLEEGTTKDEIAIALRHNPGSQYWLHAAKTFRC